MNARTLARLAAEAIGTFALVFAGTGAIVVNDVSHGAVTQVGIAVTFGLVVLSMIYAVGDVSGAHFNPAVTLGFWFGGRMRASSVAPYVGSQIAGAVCASAALRVMFPHHATLGATIPAGSALQSFALESLLTFFLMFVILGVSTVAKEKGTIAGLAIGAVIAFDALFAGPISGASMNPARSFAPALLTGRFDSLWIYVLAPVLGACAAALATRLVRPAMVELAATPETAP